MKNLSYTLWQIASWTSDESEVLIPALQRGLVWKPRQVELLWDSILRGFPIGSFMLSDIVNKEGYERTLCDFFSDFDAPCQAKAEEKQ